MPSPAAAWHHSKPLAARQMDRARGAGITVPSLVTAAVYVIRTYLEDRTLMRELPGYREFAQTTRHRLISMVAP